MIQLDPFILGGGLLAVGAVGVLLRLFTRSKPAARSGDDRAPLPEERRIDTYLVGNLVADGGTASVYEALDPQGALVALKIPHASLLADRVFVETFAREAEIGATLRHPSIVRVLETGTYAAGGFKQIPYFVMEFLHGKDLRTVIRERHTLDPMEAAQIARGVADALQWAHHRGVTHRDVSPRNIFITTRRNVKVMDFGISTVRSRTGKSRTSRGLSLGTPEYLAPERANDARSSDARSDLYSLGCVFYEMLTGNPPFVGEDAREILLQHRGAPVPPLGRMDARIHKIVMRLLEKDPDKRYQSANQVTADLADLLPVV